MNENVKTYVFPEGGASAGGLDPNLLLAMNNGGGGFGGGAWNNPIWALAFLAFLGGGFGFGNFGGGAGGCGCNVNGQLNAIREQLSTNQNSTLLMDAIKGNASAITSLASNLNLNTNAVNAAINGVQAQIANLASQYGMGNLQTINAINSGNASLQSAFQQCCCENKLLTQQMGYEGQIRDIQQTGEITGRIGQLATSLAGGLADMGYAFKDQTCSLENAMRDQTQTILGKLSEMQNNAKDEKIAALTTENINMKQNAVFASMIAPIKSEVDAIRSAQPNTVPVQWPQLAVYQTQPNGYPVVQGYPTGGFWGY